MAILVTGANGLLATNIIKILLEKDHEVIGFLRNSKKFALQPHANLTLVLGDITEPNTYKKLLSKVSCIIHVAALTSQNITAYTTYQKINALATEELFLTAREKGVKTFIYVSTANCFGFGSLANLGNENKPIAPPFSKSLYAKSKLEGQERLLELASNNASTKLVIINPTFMIGAYDTKPSSGRLLLSAYGKKVLFYPPGGKSFINVVDAANAVVNSITLGKHREAYILSGENLSYQAFYKKVTKKLNQSPLYLPIPKFILLGLGYVGNVLRFFNIQTDLSLTNIQTLCINNFYSNNKAKENLQLQQNPIEKGITEAIEWFKLK